MHNKEDDFVTNHRVFYDLSEISLRSLRRALCDTSFGWLITDNRAQGTSNGADVVVLTTTKCLHFAFAQNHTLLLGGARRLIWSPFSDDAPRSIRWRRASSRWNCLFFRHRFISELFMFSREGWPPIMIDLHTIFELTSADRVIWRDYNQHVSISFWRGTAFQSEGLKMRFKSKFEAEFIHWHSNFYSSVKLGTVLSWNNGRTVNWIIPEPQKKLSIKYKISRRS